MFDTQIVISADSHVFEPPTLWIEGLDKQFRDRAPEFVDGHDGKEGTYLRAEGIRPYRIGGISALNVKPEDLPDFNRAGWLDLRSGGWDPAERIKDQDIDGVSAEIVYSTFAMYLFAMPDQALQHACFQAYNTWLADYCSYAPSRIMGLAMISLGDLDAATAELERCANLGLKGAMVTLSLPNGEELSNLRFDRFWAAAAAHRMPISFHILTGSRKSTPRFTSDVFGAGFYMAIPHEMQLTLTDIIVRGVLQRHPELKLVLAEGDIGWLGHFLERLDRAHKRYTHLNQIYLDLTPSEYFRRQVYATFINDRAGVVSRDLIGVENLMWSSDYPHTDSCWPESRKVIAHDFAGVPAEHVDLMVSKNVARLYDFELGASSVDLAAAGPGNG
jgi:predicted TIM-barrel fold metal-dependent hydrolase